MSKSLTIPKFPDKGDLSDASDVNDISDAMEEAFDNLQRSYIETASINGPYAITSSTDYSIAHGLSTKPYLVSIHLICTTGEHGYSIGDHIIASASHMIKEAAVGNDYMVWTDGGATSDTHTRIRTGIHTSIFAAPDKSSQAIAELTNANWTMYVYIYSSESVVPTSYFTKPTPVENDTSNTNDLNLLTAAIEAAF